MRVSRGNAFVPLIDGEATFRRIVAEIETATHDIDLLQLYNKSRFVPDPARPQTLDEALLSAARRGVRVRVLLNGNWLAPDDYAETRRWFDARAAGLPIEVRRIKLGAGVAHAKMLLADRERAILIDPPFEPMWWDTRKHPVRSRLRPGLPEHNVSSLLRGPVVAELADLFDACWGAPAARRPEPLTAGALSVRLDTTRPAGILDRLGASDVLREYERAFEAAEGFVYVENQYFTSRKARRALRRALDRRPDLRAILVLNERPDAPLYPWMQDARLRELGWPHDPRVGVFSLWSSERGAVRPIYVHSKLAMADDRWATIGSANLDDIGLDRLHLFGVPDIRSLEVNVTILDGLDAEPATGDVAALRRALWSEHLGLPEVELADLQGADWLALWQRRADENEASLRGGQASMLGHVLRYHPRLPPRLRRLGRFVAATTDRPQPGNPAGADAAA